MRIRTCVCHSACDSVTQIYQDLDHALNYFFLLTFIINYLYKMKRPIRSHPSWGKCVMGCNTNAIRGIAAAVHSPLIEQVPLLAKTNEKRPKSKIINAC